MPRRSPRALALWGAALVVAVVTAVVVAGDLAALHRRAAELGPERRRGRRRPRPAPRATTSRPATSTTRTRASLAAARQPCATQRSALVGRVVAVPVVRGRVRRHRQPRTPSPDRPRRRRARAACGRCASWSPTRCDHGPGAAVDVLASFDPGGAGERDDGTVRRGRRRHGRSAPTGGAGAVPDGPAPRESRCSSIRDQAAGARRRAGQRRGHARARATRGRGAPLASGACPSSTPSSSASFKASPSSSRSRRAAT